MKLLNTSMKVLFGALLAVATSSVYAGNFVTLRHDLPNLTTANGGLVNGTNNPLTDKGYLATTSVTWLAGYNNPTANPSALIPTSLTYTANNTTSPYAVTATSTLTLLDYHVSYNVPLLAGVAQGTIYDFVFRDSIDNSLVFGTRYINAVDNNQEINYLYRYGFSGYTTASAWTFLSDYDLRLYQSGMTSDHSYAASVAFDDGAVRQKSDISVSEGNPNSGLYLVKTNATDYTWGAQAIGYYQAGEEGQSVVGGYIAGFVATTVAAVPEPSEYGMMLIGLGLIGAIAGRRKNKIIV